MVPYKGTVIDILVQITGGIRSGLSYCGGHDINKCKIMLNLSKCHVLDLQKVNHMMLMWYS